MPKEEWGTKRLCPETGKRFYDLNANPIISPYTGSEVTVDTGKTRTMVADAEDAQTKKMEAADADQEDDLVLDDEEDESDDVDLGDDVLEDDDDDTVSLDELADVATNDGDE
ncbi:MAG: TIGR02300 family protein [Pseudomonadota bacterium]